LGRITGKSPPAYVAAVETAGPIDHVDCRIGACPRFRHIGANACDVEHPAAVGDESLPFALRPGMGDRDLILRAPRDRSSLAIRRQDERRSPQSRRQEQWRERILSVAQKRPAFLASTTSFHRPYSKYRGEAGRPRPTTSPLDHAPRKGVNAAWTTNTFFAALPYETPVFAFAKGGLERPAYRGATVKRFALAFRLGDSKFTLAHTPEMASPAPSLARAGFPQHPRAPSTSDSQARDIRA
jgi:hypothetical protein